ncbi:hypothetical protein DL767_000086 [Monosporascus sp. MG133]|nr:hypothetical protein DL767_000086 [Monosporascus sp. MG133]
MPRSRAAEVKQEVVDLDRHSPSPISSRVKPPPPIAEKVDARSTVISNYRSDAPSAETVPQWARDHGETPILLQTRIRREGSQMSSPSPQNPEASFAQRSFAHPAFTGIGLKLKACNDTLGNLQQLGIQHVATLPELVLVGDQSAGKSSLMSGLARLNLPRSGGVCTRCPIHIRMSSSNGPQWSCTVSLQLDYVYQPRGRIRTTDVTDRNPFPPWVQKPNRDTKTFKTIYDQTEIEDVLRWAQVAILNPNRNHELYVPDEGAIAKETELTVAAGQTEAQFSPNIVALEMKGPDLPDLSFYDLPGVFLSPDREENDYLVKVVRNLTRFYIQRPEAIIMWALPMNHDLENSICLGIIREARATDRTIGVITKADMIEEGNIPQWLAVLRGRKQSVRHGFFITSLPPGEALENAAQREDNFFRGGVSTWPNEFAEFEEQCGVERLREYITKQLGIAFSRSLPSIKIKVVERLNEVEHQLATLPELPANVEHEVRTCLSEFYRQIKVAVKEPAFLSRWGKLNSQFKYCIFKIKPTCIVREAPQTIDLESDTETVASQTPKRLRPSDSTVRATPSKRPREMQQQHSPVKHEDGFATNTPMRQPSFGGTPVPEQTPFARYLQLGRSGMDIREIRREIMEKKRAGMPHNLVPPEVYEAMCLRAIKRWEAPLELYTQKTMEILKETVNNVLESSLEKFRQRVIFKESYAHLRAFLVEHETRQRARLIDRFHDETYQMFTINDEAYERFKAQEAEALDRARNIARLKAATLIDWNYVTPPVEKMSPEAKKKERQMMNDLLPRLGEDPFKTELQVASVVRGYYLTSATHFVEGVTKDVNSRLFRSFSQGELDTFLDRALGLFPYPTPDIYQSLMEEDAQIAREREQLKRERDKLRIAIESIAALENSSAEDDAHETSTHTSAHTIDVDLVEEEDELMEDGAA